MLYDTLTLWNANGRAWIAYRNSRGRELSMGPASTTGDGDDRECRKAVAWAQSHNMTIVDNRIA